MKSFILAALIAAVATPSLAEIQIRNAYARSGMPGASSGGAYMTIVNTGPMADRLIGVATEEARKIQLHSNILVDGVAQMREITSGITLEPGTLTVLMRGGNHLMLMGLVTPLLQDDTIRITLIFEQAGEILIEIPVDYLAIDPLGSNGAVIETQAEAEAAAALAAEQDAAPEDGEVAPETESATGEIEAAPSN